MIRQTKRTKSINARGLANGWHAIMLADKAKRIGNTMAKIFEESIKDSVAFSVPAHCEGSAGQYDFYVFSDGSKLRIKNFS